MVNNLGSFPICPIGMCMFVHIQIYLQKFTEMFRLLYYQVWSEPLLSPSHLGKVRVKKMRSFSWLVQEIRLGQVLIIPLNHMAAIG